MKKMAKSVIIIMKWNQWNNEMKNNEMKIMKMA